MEIILAGPPENQVAEIISDRIEINNAQDALNILANCSYQGADKIIVHEKNITPGLFDLKTGIAGEVFQKCSNYRVRMAIVGDFSGYTSNSLRDFIFESNKQGQVIFVSSVEEAKERFADQR
ncbi:MAG: DUF4180 domain-containing protein [Bacteroidales bacterium]|nr:DUF4180 domain-containing protein [Bacteroidales bacterium]